ncbi:MAG TPA: hypothetical protein VFA10_28045 [Ktedonobacteraceae bacterium]|nr:hypothetical protein [Ktedonobacteraceae bacterium]
MEPLPPSYRFRQPDERVPAEYRHLTSLRNEQPVGTGCLQFELIVNAFMLGGLIGGPITLLFGPNVTGFIIGTILGGILAVGVLWEPTCRMVARAENDPNEYKRLRKQLDNIDFD